MKYKKGMMYKEIYNGNFYDIYDGDVSVLRKCPIEDLFPIMVPNNDLIEGDLYLTDNGSTVKYMGGTSYEVIKRTPLYGNDSITSLTEEGQLRMFWSLVMRCKNGTGKALYK